MTAIELIRKLMKLPPETKLLMKEGYSAGYLINNVNIQQGYACIPPDAKLGDYFEVKHSPDPYADSAIILDFNY